jgi:hypothetical protein
MAHLLNSINRFGYTFTAPNEYGSSYYNPKRKYTIRKFKYRKTMTFIGFYDTISNSLCFGFKVRKYPKVRFVYIVFGSGYRAKEPVPPEFYKEVIQTLKAQTKHIC